MEIKFTASVIEAVECALQLAHGNLWVHPKGTVGLVEEMVKAARPSWCNFSFFSRIKASPVRRKTRVAPTEERLGHWKLERRIEFFHAGAHVATVDLVGIKIDGHDLDNESFWAVARIGYFQRHDGGLYTPPSEWKEVEREVVSLRARLVA
ncbi:MAG: hypothetical protein HY435_00890 [Candidatus Liptonbacteria bacterium]|nr:hypothetical protein [Candidatus Liptonbacteria bacterium]